MKKFKIFVIVTLAFSSLYFLFFQFQNCAKVNYQTQAGVTVTTTGTNSNEKVVEVNPEFFTDPSDLKILFVVDDSFTMSQSRAQLANAMDSLVNPLKGRNSEIRIVSTTGILNNQLDYINEDEYIGAGGVITQAEAQSLPNYGIKRHYYPSKGVRHQPLTISKYFSDSQFEEVKAKIKQQVQAVGNQGNDNEETICAAIHQLFDKSGNNLFNPGDKAAVIFISDENDGSLFTACSKTIAFKASNKPQIYYSYQQQRVQAVVEYYVNKDGVKTAITNQLGIPFKHPVNDLSECTAADREAVKVELVRQGYQLISVNSCTYTTQEIFYYGADFGDTGVGPAKDLCSAPVTFQGINYANMYAYIRAAGYYAMANSCKKTTSQANSMFITDERVPTVQIDAGVEQRADLIEGLKLRSEQIFGSGYIVASLVRRQNDGCALNQGQSVGSVFESVTSRLGENAVIETLCANSFTNILGNVSKFMISHAQKSYSLKVLSDNEYIKGINVKRGSNTFSLSSHQYEVVGHTFTLLSFEPQTGDIFQVLIGIN